MAKRKKKGHSGGALRTRLLVGLTLATVTVLYAIALAAYLQDGNWQRPAAELASRMGRMNHLAARSTVGLLGVTGSVLLAVAGGLLATRFLAGRKLPGTGRRTMLTLTAAALLAGSLAALPGGALPPERALVAGSIGHAVVAGLHALFGGVGAIVVLVGATAAFFATVGVPIFAPLEGLAEPLLGLWDRVAEFFASTGQAIRDAFPGEETRAKRAKAPARSRAAAAEAEDEEEEETEVRVVRPARAARVARPTRAAGDPEGEDWVGDAAPAIAVAPSRRKPAAEAEDEELEEDEEYEDEEYEEGDEYEEDEDGEEDEEDEDADEYEEDDEEYEDDEEEDEDGEEDEADEEAEDLYADVPVTVLPPAGEPKPRPRPEVEAELGPEDSLTGLADTSIPYQRPPNDFLEIEEEDADDARIQEQLVESAKVLERTLKDFGVKGKVTQVQPGPVITRYEIEPA
ncbi:MAG: hypothetical protein KC591_09195, partial [Gemmatimonadetes bacterium]|nr:hypothetical protein [Gemmatimonadota bacterium]